MANIGLYEWTVVLIGMGTVFSALIGLSFILGGFAIFSKLRSQKKNAAKEIPTAPGSTASSAAEASEIAPEVVAAITAAVAAASGSSASVVRISRISHSQPGPSGLNTPVWGYANRLAAGRR